MLKVERSTDYLKGASLEITEPIEEEQNTQQSSKSFQPKPRIRRQYSPNDNNLQLLSLIARYKQDPALINDIKGLLNKVDINYRDKDGDTFLHAAIQEEHQDVVKLILEKRARIDIENNAGKTPLSLANELDNRNPNKQSIIQMLDQSWQKDDKRKRKQPPSDPNKRQKFDQDNSFQFAEKTLNQQDYQVWLTQEDVANIARIKYGWYGENSNVLFEVIGSVGQLDVELKRHKEIPKAPSKQSLIFIINLNSNHWVTLVIIHQNQQFSAYYINSFGDEITSDIRDKLNSAMPGIQISNPKFKQQEDGYNCGIFALENARIINDKIKSGKTNLEIEQALKGYELTSDDLKNKRKEFAEELQQQKAKLDYEGSTLNDSSAKKSSSTEIQKPKAVKRPNNDQEVPNKKVKPSSQKYSKSGLVHTLHGDIYQLKLLMLFVKRGLDRGYLFELATEMDVAEKFDDLVFQYEKNNADGTEEKVGRFLQAKHKQDEDKKISVNDLLTETNGEFSLQKYFISYRKIQQNLEFKNSNLQYKGFIICTNIGFKFGDKRSNLELSEDIFDHETDENEILNTKLFQFKDEFTGREEIFSVLRNAPDLTKLAKELAECVLDGKSISNDKSKNDLKGNHFKSYQSALIDKVINKESHKLSVDFVEGQQLSSETENLRVAFEEVFNDRRESFKLDDTPIIKNLESFASEVATLIKNQPNNVVEVEKRKRVIKDNFDKLAGYALIKKDNKIKFSTGFLNNDELPGNLNIFRRELQSKLPNFDLGQCEFKIYKDFKTCEEIYVDKDNFWEKIKEKELKLFKDFGKLDTNLESTGKFVEKFVSLLEESESKENRVVKIKRTDKIISKNIDKLAQHVLIEEKDEIRFSSEFLSDTQLPGNLNDFRSQLKAKLKELNFDWNVLKEYKFYIGNFPKFSLPNDSIKEIEENIKDFLKELRFAVNQPNEDKLGEMIKDELGKEFNTIDRKNVYGRFLEKMLDWMKDKEGKFFTHEEGKNFFEGIRKEILGTIWFNMKDPVTLFTGRKRELSDLHKALQRNQGKDKFTVISQMTSISGLGGIGKSELARKYAYDHENDYDGNVIWINAENYGTLEDSFLNLARDNRLGIPTKDRDGKEKTVEATVKEIYGFFAKRKSLFIFDNAENNEYLNRFLPLRSLAPDVNKPYILITSRNREWEKGIEVMDLNELKLENAIEFVRKGLGISEEDESQDQEIKNLVEKLQRFPLAIQQAIAYIEYQRVTGEFGINDYLKEYEKKTKDLLDSKLFRGIDNCYARTTFTTWKITIDKIASNEQHGKLALKILDTISYFAPENISREIFLSLAEGDEEKLKSASRLLVKYSMVNGEQKQSVLSIHRLVQEVTRINLKDREKEVLRKALELFQGDSSQINLFDDNFRLNNVDHAISVWRYANNHKELVREFSSLPVLIVSELNASLRYQEAYLFGSNALKLLEKILGDNHPSVLSMMNNIASVLYTQGKDDDALEIYRKLKEKSYIINKLVMPKRVFLFDNYIGLILNRQGKYDEALEIFSHLYSLVKEGKINSDGSIEHNIGLTLSEQGKLNDAMEMFKNALKQKEEVLGPDHESTLNTKNSIAAVLERQGKYEDVLKMHWEIYEKRKKNLGPNHPNTLTTYGNIALSLTKLSRYDEALKIANEVEKEREKLFPNHPRTLKGKLLIVEILGAQGKYDKALEKCKKVYEKRKEVLGPNHPDTLTTLDAWYGLALKFAKQRKYDKALKELNEVLEERKRILKPNHPDILQTEDAISKVRRARDNGADINFKIVDRELFSAAQKGQLEVVNELLSKGVEVNVQTADEGVTPLHFAAQNDHARVVEKLLEGEADVNAKDINGSTALHIAAHRNYLDVVNALLKGDADVNCYDNALFRPLHFAAQEGHTKIVELLLKNGADIEATNIDGLTPLYIAAYYKHLDVVKILLEGGANIDAVNKHNMIPDFINKVLLSTKQLPNAIRRKHNKSDVQRLLEDGAVINYFSDTSRLTSLHYAVSGGNLDIVVLLLGKKPDVNVADEDGWTPLHYTAQDGHLDIVKLLLDHRADPTVQNSDRKTPLDLAQEKSSQNPQVYQEIIKILTESINQQQKTDPINQGGEVSSEECLPGPSSGNRRKREAKGECLFTWEDVDEFNEEKDEKRDFDKIKIDSEKFVSYIKDLPKEKQSQLIQLASGVKVTGESQSLVNKLISNQKVMSHLSRVGRISGMTMHGMMAKNVLADFLNGDYQGVAINVGFIAGGQGFAKVAEAASLKGLKLASEGKLLLGRSLRAASPFLARGTSAFVVYDLVNQVKAFKNGTEEALVGVVGDSIYLGVDAAEIGIEIAEAFEVLEGVSSITGPIGATIGAVVFVGTDIYMAVKRVDKIDQIIHLKGNERFIEGLRAFIGMQPEKHIEELIEEKQLYNQLVKQGLEYLKQHSDIQSYVFPTGKSVVDSCRKVSYKTSICDSGGLGGRCLKTRTVTRYAEECTTKFEVDLDNTVQLDRKRTDIKWSRAKPDNPSGGELFCLPRGNHERVPSYGSYLCENAIGLSTKTGNHTLINLGEGTDHAKGFIDSPNIFVVNNGSKRYFGGNKDDIFILQGSSITGYFYGEGGVNTLDLTSFAPEKESIDVKLHIGQVEDYYRKNFFGMSGINKFLGRKAKADQVFITCDSDTSDIKFVDGQSGSEGFVDHINIHDKDCAYEMQIVVRPNTVIYNRALKGDFHYIVPYALGSAKVDFIYTAEALNLNNTFAFEYEPAQIKNVDVRNINVLNKTSHIITFNFSPMSDKEFNITISGASNPSYRLGNNTEIKVGNKGNLYMLENTNKSVNEIIKDYLVVANRLNKMSFFIQSLLSNETVVIGSGNHEVIHNNPAYRSHLVGNGGENVYVIDSKRFEIPLPEVVIYDLDVESSVDTIDLRNLVRQVRGKLSNQDHFQLKVLKSANDLLLKATIVEVKPTEDSSVSKMRKHEYCTVRLKDGVNWYNKTHVIVDNAPMKINLDNNEWSLKPLPLKFEKDKEVIIVTSQDIEENTELITPKRAGNYSFVSDHGNDLIVTNAFDVNVAKNDLCTIVLSKFYEKPKMATLSIKFADKEIILKEHQEEISSARDVNVVKKEYKDQVYNGVFNHTKSSPEVIMLSDQPVTHRHRHSGHREQTRHRRSTSSGIRPTGWINDLFGWVRSSISGLLSSKPESTPSSISQVDARVDVNGTIMLLDVFIRKVTGQKYISTVDQPISPLEAQGYALNITGKFEKVVEQAAKDSKISMHRLNIDFVGIQKEVTGKIMSGKFNEISGILKSYVEKACPGEEAGKLSSKKFNKFIAQFNKGLLNQSIEQILHTKNGTLEVDGAKKQQTSLEPQSYLSNASVHSHSEVSTCLSEIGVTKLGGNINR